MNKTAWLGAVLGLILMLALALTRSSLREINIPTTVIFVGGGAIACYILGRVVAHIKGTEKMSWALKLGTILFLLPVPFFFYGLFSPSLDGWGALGMIGFSLVAPVPGFIIGALIGRAIDRKGNPVQAADISNAIQKTVTDNPISRLFNYFLK